VEVTPAVQDVAGHGATGMGEVQADLVGAAGLGHRLEPPTAVATFTEAERRDHPLDGAAVGERPAEVVGGVDTERAVRRTAVPGGERRLQLLRGAGGEAVVLLDGASAGECLLEPDIGTRRTREHEHPAGLAVEAMCRVECADHTVAGDQPARQRHLQIARHIPWHGVHDHAGRLVDDEQIGVFVEDPARLDDDVGVAGVWR